MDIEDFQWRVGDWSDQTFPDWGLKACANHILKEAKELRDAPDRDNVAEEAADIALMLFHIAHRYEFDLIDACIQKFEILKTREWGEPDENGVIEHIRTKEEQKFKL